MEEEAVQGVRIAGPDALQAEGPIGNATDSAAIKLNQAADKAAKETMSELTQKQAIATKEHEIERIDVLLKGLEPDSKAFNKAQGKKDRLIGEIQELESASTTEVSEEPLATEAAPVSEPAAGAARVAESGQAEEPAPESGVRETARPATEGLLPVRQTDRASGVTFAPAEGFERTKSGGIRVSPTMEVKPPSAAAAERIKTILGLPALPEQPPEAKAKGAEAEGEVLTAADIIPETVPELEVKAPEAAPEAVTAEAGIGEFTDEEIKEFYDKVPTFRVSAEGVTRFLGATEFAEDLKLIKPHLGDPAIGPAGKEVLSKIKQLLDGIMAEEERLEGVKSQAVGETLKAVQERRILATQEKIKGLKAEVNALQPAFEDLAAKCRALEEAKTGKPGALEQKESTEILTETNNADAEPTVESAVKSPEQALAERKALVQEDLEDMLAKFGQDYAEVFPRMVNGKEAEQAMNEEIRKQFMEKAEDHIKKGTGYHFQVSVNFKTFSRTNDKGETETEIQSVEVASKERVKEVVLDLDLTMPESPKKGPEAGQKAVEAAEAAAKKPETVPAKAEAGTKGARAEAAAAIPDLVPPSKPKAAEQPAAAMSEEAATLPGIHEDLTFKGETADLLYDAAQADFEKQKRKLESRLAEIKDSLAGEWSDAYGDLGGFDQALWSQLSGEMKGAVKSEKEMLKELRYNSVDYSLRNLEANNDLKRKDRMIKSCETQLKSKSLTNDEIDSLQDRLANLRGGERDLLMQIKGMEDLRLKDEAEEAKLLAKAQERLKSKKGAEAAKTAAKTEAMPATAEAGQEVKKTGTEVKEAEDGSVEVDLEEINAAIKPEAPKKPDTISTLQVEKEFFRREPDYKAGEEDEEQAATAKGTPGRLGKAARGAGKYMGSFALAAIGKLIVTAPKVAKFIVWDAPIRLLEGLMKWSDPGGAWTQTFNSIQKWGKEKLKKKDSSQ